MYATPPSRQTMKGIAAEKMSLIDSEQPEKKPWNITEELIEEIVSLKDTRRVFVLVGPTLVGMLAFLPVWNALSLLSSSTYLYFSGWQSPLGGALILCLIIIALWLTKITGVGCGCCPMPSPAAALSPVGQRLRWIPFEAYMMIFLAFFLMLIWKAVPIIYVEGFEGCFAWLRGFIDVFKTMCFSTNPAATVLAFALTTLMLYVLALNVFFARGRKEDKNTTRKLFFVLALFVFVMGIAFVLLSVPITFEADRAYNEILLTCETGPRTRDLFITSQALQSLRQSAGCSDKFSVEDCPGYQRTEFTRILHSMENEFKCAGFCYNAAAIVPQAGRVPVTTSAPTDGLESATPFEINRRPPSAGYPPTLFTQANFPAACDSMAARSMQSFVSPAGSLIYYQGLCLCIASVALALAQLGGASEKEGFTPQDAQTTYGSMT